MTFAQYAVLAVYAAIQAPAPQSGPLTIDQAASIAERNAFSVRLQTSAVERSRQGVALAISNTDPKVNLGANYVRYGSESTIQFAPNSPPTVIQPISTQSATISLSLPLDITGNNGRLVRASQLQYRASKETLASSLNDARLNARNAFLAVLRAQALVDVYAQSLKDAQERLHQGQLQLQQQQVAKVDVERLDAAVAQATSDLLVTQNNLQLARNALNFALARPIETPVDLVDIPDLPPTSLDAERLNQQAQDSRPEVRALRTTVEALSYVRRAQEGGMAPSLSLGVGQTRNIDASGLTAQSATTTASLSLNIPLFDSGTTRARVRQARQDEVQAKINLEQAQLGISQEVRSAVASLANAQARYQNAQRQQALAAEVYRLAVVRQQAGEGTYVDIIDAETAQTQARNGVVSARYDYLTAYAQLQRALGTDQIPTAQIHTESASGGGNTR